MSLIADAEALDSADELIDYLGPAAQVDEDDTLVLTIGSEYLGEFVVLGTRAIHNENGKVDWSSVQRLKLVNILRSA